MYLCTCNIYMYVYTCIYIYMYTDVYTHPCVYIYIHTYTYVYISFIRIHKFFSLPFVFSSFFLFPCALVHGCIRVHVPFVWLKFECIFGLYFGNISYV